MKRVQEGLIEEYEINPYTLLIKPIQYGSEMYSQIFELEDQFISPFKPMDIIKRSCEYFGSSYEGRKDGTKHLIGITHKAPIAVDPTSSIFFFPTSSPARPQCMWLSHHHISKFNRADTGMTSVVFRNQQEVEIDISYSSFGNQVMRTALLKTKLLQRIEETERQQYYLVSRKGIAEQNESASKYSMLR